MLLEPSLFMKSRRPEPEFLAGVAVCGGASLPDGTVRRVAQKGAKRCDERTLSA